VAASEPTYHLWLEVPREVNERLSAIIRSLAQELGGPVFEPHVTLLSLNGTDEDSHVGRTRALGQELSAFSIILTGLSHRREYFQSLFATVQPTDAVMQARARAAATFGVGGPYMPHLSLLYGIHPDERKNEIVSRLEPAIRGTFVASAIQLIRADSLDPKDWHAVFSAPLRPPASRVFMNASNEHT
jgi:2'-5' RNA ligase